MSNSSCDGRKAYRQEWRERLDDPNLNGPLGALFAKGKIGRLELEAGRRFVLMVKRYGMAIDASFAPAGISRAERFYGKSIDRDIEADQAERLRETYDRAPLPSYMRDELIRVCVYGEPVGNESTVTSGLVLLISYFGLCGEAKDLVRAGPGDSPRLRSWLQPGAKPSDRPDVREAV